jgi:hypothetical protein
MGEMVQATSENRRPNDAGTSLSPTTQRRVVQTTTVGSSVESLAGIGAVTLAILGLAGVLPFVFAAIATIVVGGALLLEGLALASAYVPEARESALSQSEEAAVGGGLSVQTLGGAAGIALGILALVDIAPLTLLSVAQLVFGGVLLLSGPVRAEMVNQHALTADTIRSTQTAQAVKASSAAMSMAGLAALALGILAILKVGSVATLVLVALLVTGGASLLGGSALVTRAARALH